MKIDSKQLVALAFDSAKKAYAPYSGCCVGAALLTKSGKLYFGCNIENASYSPTVCAERVAIFKAVSEGEKEFDSIAVACIKNGAPSSAFPPCGVCRQVMSEFFDADTKILVASGDGFDEYTLSQLLPNGFSPKHLED